MAVNNNLYPPIVNTYAPVFIIKDGEDAKCKIPVDFSSYNSPSDINRDAIQVIVSYQSTNKNALDIDKYPSQILFTSLNEDNTITIKGSDLQDGNFKINTYYKIQIRFTKADVSGPASMAADKWLATYLESFSEWSTVVLARGTSYSGIILSNFPIDSTTILNNTSVRVIGKLEFENEQEQDFLQSYRIVVEDGANPDSEEPLYQTQDIFNEGGDLGKNEINHLIKYAFQNSGDYTLYIAYKTKLGFEGTSALYNFTIITDTSTATTDINIDVTADNEEGRIAVRLSKLSTSEFNIKNKVVILRSSSKEKFTIWEDVFIGEIHETIGTTLDYTWYDYTAESGVWYSYGIQTIEANGARTIMNPSERNYVMVASEYSYLVADNKQFKIKFDSNISSFKRNISESKTDTIGSKYPFIKRNGYVDYRTFPISGLISYFTDEENTLTSKSKILGEYMDKYAQYNQDNNISEYNDYIYEKAFRDVVMDFLYKNNVKLFKSTTEGNIMVKLMDINFTPNATLENYVYSFSCTAYEVDECTVENYDKYNIQNINQDTITPSEQEVEIVEVYSSYTGVLPANENLLDAIAAGQQSRALVNSIVSAEYLDYLKIQINSEPYLIIDIDNIPTIANEDSDPDSVYMGYIVYINEKPFVVSPEGTYILSGEDIQITSVKLAKDGDVEIQYNAILKKATKRDATVERVTYYSRVAQLTGPFAYQDSLYTKIWNTYYLDVQDEYKQVLVSINSMDLDVEPGAVFYMRPSTEDIVIRYVVGETGVLDFYDENYIIKEAYFAGKHFEEATAEEAVREQLPETKFVESGITLTNSYDEATLKANYIYILNGIRCLWYNKTFYPIDENNDIQCPVEGLVDYTCDIMKGYYA